MDGLLTTLKAVSDRNRLRILAALMQQGELCACQLTELLQVAGATVSRHLQRLQNANLVKGRKEGRWVFFRLNDEREAIFMDWLEGELRRSPEIAEDRKRLRQIMKIDTEMLCRRQRGEECCPK